MKASGPCRDDEDKMHMKLFHLLEAPSLTGEQLKELCCTYMRKDQTLDWRSMRVKAEQLIPPKSLKTEVSRLLLNYHFHQDRFSIETYSKKQHFYT